MKSKAFFIIFEGFSVPENCLRPNSAPLIENLIVSKISQINRNLNSPEINLPGW